MILPFNTKLGMYNTFFVAFHFFFFFFFFFKILNNLHYSSSKFETFVKLVKKKKSFRSGIGRTQFDEQMVLQRGKSFINDFYLSTL